MLFACKTYKFDSAGGSSERAVSLYPAAINGSNGGKTAVLQTMLTLLNRKACS
jgi:hypothetical protein